jgi:hypothetical protein
MLKRNKPILIKNETKKITVVTLNDSFKEGMIPLLHKLTRFFFLAADIFCLDVYFLVSSCGSAVRPRLAVPATLRTLNS